MTEPSSLRSLLRRVLERFDALRWTGQVTQVVGLLVESRGPAAAIGDFCEIQTAAGGASARR